MRDTELALRYFAFTKNVEGYQGNLKEFLDDFSKTMNEKWEDNKDYIFQQAKEFEEAVSFAAGVFGEKNISRKWNGKKYESQLNRAVFDVIFYYFSNPDVREAATGKLVEIKEKFQILCVDNKEFKEAIESSTKNLDRVRNRFTIWGTELKNIVGDSVVIPNIPQR